MRRGSQQYTHINDVVHNETVVARRLRSKAQKFVIQRVEMHWSTFPALEMKSLVSLRKCREVKNDNFLYQMTDKDQITTVGDN